MAIALIVLWGGQAKAAVAGENDPDNLVITQSGSTDAIIVLSPHAGHQEKAAAEDLARYIGLMSDARPVITTNEDARDAALASTHPLFLLGEAALELRPDLRSRLEGAAKKRPYLRSDAILLQRQGRRVYLAGNNDEAHYYAVAELLKRWGVRWYMPGQFGECVPTEPDLAVGRLDFLYSPPFEVRTYWLSWLGDPAGQRDFQLRNGMTDPRGVPPSGHALGQYTKGLGKGRFDIPLTAPKTAEQVAKGVEANFAKGSDFSLAMEDGLYASDDPRDKELSHLQWDRSMLRWSVTDPMLELYSNVLQVLRQKYPDSPSKVGFLAYSNMTLPPVRAVETDPALFAMLAPIDIDPNHGMDDLRSPERQDLRAILAGWAKVMNMRVIIYDYDQGMLIWRDLPDPSFSAFREDVQHYRAAGILGVDTESRGALATTFLNLFLRAELLWNPDVDVDALLSEFYPRFYGPAAEPMRDYWTAIFQAWSQTDITEHEYFAAPAIYTPELVGVLEAKLAEADRAIQPLLAKQQALSSQEILYLERMKFTHLSFDVIKAYTTMVRLAASEVDFTGAVAVGHSGLQARDALTAMNKTFTATRMETGYPWWAGEIKQYEELAQLLDGTRGHLVQSLPLSWAARLDPNRTGLERGFAVEPVELRHGLTDGVSKQPEARKDFGDDWEELRTDLYVGAQGVRQPDRRGFVGEIWYRTDLTLPANQAGQKLHLMFPGLFGECRLYLDGLEIDHRQQNPLWWQNDYRFEWDVDLTGKFRPGFNGVAVACDSQGHFAGMFRRPFLYNAVL